MSSTSPVYDLSALLATDIREVLPEEYVADIINRPPFVSVPGTFNVRDLGAPGRSLRSQYIYRSGTLSNLTDEGKTVLVQKLGIRKIFDLRNPSERAKSPSPEIPGAEVIWVPYSADPGEINLADFAKGPDDFTGFLNMYRNILDISGPIYRKVFEHARDCPREPLLFHCTGELALITHAFNLIAGSELSNFNNQKKLIA